MNSTEKWSNNFFLDIVKVCLATTKIQSAKIIKNIMSNLLLRAFMSQEFYLINRRPLQLEFFLESKAVSQNPQTYEDICDSKHTSVPNLSWSRTMPQMNYKQCHSTS